MAPKSFEEERQPLHRFRHDASDRSHTESRSSVSSISTTSLILERLGDSATLVAKDEPPYSDHANGTRKRLDSFDDIQEPDFRRIKGVDKSLKRALWIIGLVGIAGWSLALASFISTGSYKHSSTRPHDPAATASRGSGKKVTLSEVQMGLWQPTRHQLSWINGANGEDGLLLERDGENSSDYLAVEDVRDLGKKGGQKRSNKRKTLMEESGFDVDGTYVYPNKVWPSPDLTKVLVLSHKESNWRHSYTGRYWIFDVESQEAEPLDPADPDGRIQLATWSPTSDAIVFTRKNNMYLRQLDAVSVSAITKDGGPELFYGVPDWVYEEEVFGGNSATWWSEDGKYIAYLRTNESAVPTYPVQYFLSRPSGKQPLPGLENYPEVRDIKYPKAGAPNPTVNLLFFDIERATSFSLDVKDDFEDDNRLITEVLWAGKTGNVLVRETNRESDLLKVVLMDVEKRAGKTIREENVAELDGGWFEISQDTTFIPADPDNGRDDAGYVDTIIHEGFNHLAYFTPLDNSEPRILTSGSWEVVSAPSAVDLKNNLVYFIATKEGSTQRHVYNVALTGAPTITALTAAHEEGYYGVTFSAAAGYALLSYNGPDIPWQKVISTPSNNDDQGSFEHVIESNDALAIKASQHELPLEVYGTVNIDGFDLNYVERRPPHFDATKKKKKYPVLFYLYGGPGSQTVDKRFSVDFQSYVASSLGYIVVTVDGRGTGFLGREVRCSIRGNIGYLEAHDQIEAAKMWAAKRYVDEERIAIWGWSYGGFMTLKTLEQDAGRTFKYGMAVAPVTDWRFYDSIYTERYMHTPPHNPTGYENATVSSATALSKNIRFLIMHGVADDNVHLQNTLTLLDKLDQAGVENYDVHFFPDSDHGIYFHNANRVVHDKLSNWLVNAFNGEWLRVGDAEPVDRVDRIDSAG